MLVGNKIDEESGGREVASTTGETLQVFIGLMIFDQYLIRLVHLADIFESFNIDKSN